MLNRLAWKTLVRFAPSHCGQEDIRECPMGFYSDFILPRLCDLAMRNKEFVPIRERVVGAAEGSALEIGVGSGMNLPFYRPPVREVLAFEPAPRLATKARSASRATGMPVNFLESPDRIWHDSSCARSLRTKFYVSSGYRSIPRTIGRV
jgi:hypothetical protein